MSTNSLSHPSVIWAQRKNCVFLTICLEDVKDPEIKTEPSGVYFKGKGGDGKEYETKLDLFGSVDPSNSLHVVRPRNIEFCLKKEEENFWPRLTKAQAKLPWLKIDFNKWKDEDESDDEQGGGGPPGLGGMGGMGGGDGTDFEEMMRQMGGLGGAGMGGMGGMPGMPGMDKPGFDDLGKEDESDSDDDEDLPDLE